MELAVLQGERSIDNNQIDKLDDSFAWSALRSFRDAVLVMDDAGRIVFWNPCATKLFGYSEAEALGRDLHDTLVPDEYRRMFKSAFPAFIKTGKGAAIGQVLELEARHKSGRVFPVELSLSSLQRDHRWFAIGTVRDISEKHKNLAIIHNATVLQETVDQLNGLSLAELTLAEKLEQSLALILNLAWLPISRKGAIFLCDQAGYNLNLLASMGLAPEEEQQCRLLAEPPAQESGVLWTEGVDAVPDSDVIAPVASAAAGGYYRIPLMGAGDEPVGVLICYTDPGHGQADDEALSLKTLARCLESMIDRHQLYQRLNVNRQLIEQSPISVAMTDVDGRFSYVNPAFERISGYSKEELLGANPNILKSGQTPPEIYQELWSTITAGREWRGEILNRKKNGDLFWESQTISPLLNEQGETVGFSALKEDITTQKYFTDQLRQMATRDVLTGLPNSVLMNDRLEQAISLAIREHSTGAVVCIDLASLGAINDTYGNAFGDKMLKDLAARIKAFLRESDSVGRYLSDTFIVILNNIKDRHNLALTIEKFIETIEKPLGYDVQITPQVWMGASLFPSQGESVSRLIGQSVMALNYVKRKRQEKWYVYSPAIDSLITKETSLAVELEQAVKLQQLEIHYQPKINARTGVIAGAEALLRWPHADRGMIPPVEFIPLAEKSGQIIDMGRWVIQTVAAQVMRWHEMYGWRIPVSINLSPRQFSDPGLLGFVEKTFQTHQIEKGFIGFELTESVLIDNPQAAGKVMTRLNELGAFISIDDYGTGYSSLNYIHQYPVRELKIDRSFISDLTTVPSNAVIVRSTLSMCSSLGIDVVAEGVETRQQANYLARHGCDLLQGFMFSKPLSLDQFNSLLEGVKHFRHMLVTPSQVRNLLLLDDDSMILDALNRMLKDEEYQVFSTTDPDTALDLLAEHEIGVIISDQVMPEVTGTEFLHQVSELYPSTVRMILSGYADVEVILSSINRGAIYKFLTKPWNEDELKRIIHDAFKQYEISAVKESLEQRINNMCQNYKIQHDDEITSGIVELDRDHQQLVALHNRITDLYFKTDSYNEALKGMLQELVEHANLHFDREEQLMEQYQFSETTVHQQEHATLRENLARILGSYNGDQQDESFLDTLSFLKLWLNQHTEQFDSQLVDEIRKKQAASGDGDLIH